MATHLKTGINTGKGDIKLEKSSTDHRYDCKPKKPKGI
jgi:hypothetical protein